MQVLIGTFNVSAIDVFWEIRATLFHGFHNFAITPAHGYFLTFLFSCVFTIKTTSSSFIHLGPVL